MTSQIPWTIFYSWQSDLPFDTNQRGISICIKNAMVAIEEKNNSISLAYDEATRDVAGSPDIPATIFNKISNSDIFVCDITTINSSEASTRKCPNPNVLIELGYAISTLGWERIIMVFNKQFGNFTIELPFDLEKRRVTPFKITDKKDKNGKTDLSEKLVVAFETIINKNPSLPSEKKNKSAEEIMREKDVRSLSNLLACIHIQTMDFFINELPDRVVDRIFFFWHSFQSIYNTTAFHIYNSELATLVKLFQDKWGETLNHGDMYERIPNSAYYKFHMPMDIFPNEKSEKTYRLIEQESNELNIYFKQLITYIRQHFFEINLDELSNNALQLYIDHEKELLDLLNKPQQ